MMQLKSSHHPWSMTVKIRRGIWMMVWRLFGYYGPRAFSKFRVLILRLFGAKIGNNVLICGHVKVLMPWNLEIDDYTAIAEGVDIYNFDLIKIGNNTCISQGVWLCTGSHDYTRVDFPLVWKPISIGSSVWVAAEAFVHPGVVIGDGAVVGARAVVAKSLNPWSVYAGNPCHFIRTRIIKDVQE